MGDHDQELTPVERHRETARLRETGWRLMVRGMAMLRQADALEDGMAQAECMEIVRCVACSGPFPLWRGEREWFEAKRDETTGEPWTPPKRCPDCRIIRRLTRRDRART